MTIIQFACNKWKRKMHTNITQTTIEALFRRMTYCKLHPIKISQSFKYPWIGLNIYFFYFSFLFLLIFNIRCVVITIDCIWNILHNILLFIFSSFFIVLNIVPETISFGRAHDLCDRWYFDIDRLTKIKKKKNEIKKEEKTFHEKYFSRWRC